MAQNPFGGPPPFGNGAQFPQAFGQAGVPFFAPPPPPHLLMQQQQQFAAAATAASQQQQHFNPQQQQQLQGPGFGFQQQQPPAGGQGFVNLGMGGQAAAAAAGYPPAGPPQQQPQVFSNEQGGGGGGYSRGGHDRDNFRRPNSGGGYGGNSRQGPHHRGGFGGGHSDRQSGSGWGGGEQAQAGGRSSYERPNNRHDNRSSGPGRPNFSPSPSPAGSSSDLTEFGDMGAAAKNYAANVPKYQSMRSAESGGDNLPQAPPDTNQYRQQHSLTVFDSANPESIRSVPEPYQKFEDFPGLSQQQLNSFYGAGFNAPTPIQAQTWPIAMMDRDVISIAKTGSGKTLAFLLPCYKKMDARFGGANGSINVLVLAPTRELATQIQEEADKFGRAAGYMSACAYGGAGKREQLSAMRSASVLVATPGRLNDFLDSGQVDLGQVFYLVMDEADRMLDMGFEPQIRDILKRVPRRRQTLMFSATWPEEVRRLAHDFLSKPIHIQMGDPRDGLRANEVYNLILHD